MLNESSDSPGRKKTITREIPSRARRLFKTTQSLNPLISLVVTVLVTVYLLDAVGYLSSVSDDATIQTLKGIFPESIDAGGVAIRRGLEIAICGA